MRPRIADILRRVGRLVLWAGPLAVASSAMSADTQVEYRRDILPLLSDRCFACHGPDSAARQAGLRLDRPEDATAELASGVRAIVPGDVDGSELVRRILSDDEYERMPPVDSGKTLDDAERELLRRWVEAGAQYQPHWAFVAPVRPPVPTVKHQDLVQNPIDAFVFARLEAAGHKPSPRASKERLIRRLYFDLVGLPPTIGDVDEFLADDSPDAVERLIERLLNSPHYGERMAADWLDGARFADSNGYQNDFTRDMSPWRDWVIAAYNRHMPYDEFIVEQIAGDMLPNATLEQRVATGFNRNHRMVTEAGSIDEEWLVENVVDRVETTGTVMLGLTIGCARCHDHKFDPLSQREFYEFFAFFHNVAEKGVYTETRGNVPPLVKVPTSEQNAQLELLEARITRLEVELTARMSEIAPLRQPWVDSLAAMDPSTAPTAAVNIPLRQDSAAQVTVTGESLAPDSESAPPRWTGGLLGETAEFTGEQQLAYSTLQFPPADRPFSWAVWIKPAGDGAILSKMDSAAGARGCDLMLFGDRRIGAHLVDAWPANALKVLTKQPIAEGKWSHIAMTYDGSKKAAGIAIYVDGKKQELEVEADQLGGTFATAQPLRVGRRSTDFPFRGGVADVRLFSHALSALEVEAVVRDSVGRLLRGTQVEELAEPQISEFDDLLLMYGTDPAVVRAAETKRTLRQVQQERTDLEAKLPTTMVMEELPTPRETYLLKRGQYDKPDKSERLTADVPAVLSPWPEGAPRNRLGLAQWLVDCNNPLVARVAVNRLWQRFFGVGLVKNSDNFGVQSEPPSHPELLDWLATELVASDWDLQHIQRLIATSYTYQQQSEAPPELYAADPQNRLLARGPRHRLPAEALRDNALAVAGLLVTRIGGPSVMPYQPAGLWEELAGGAHEDYVQGHGEDLYRRSLYIFRKRTVPHPSLATFDAPSWEICQVKRQMTNTPLQALALLNDVTYVEAARQFAERILKEGGDSEEERLVYAFRLSTGRHPRPEELGALRENLEKYLAWFQKSPAAAAELLGHGESPRDASLDEIALAAHTTMASVLLNLDETVSKN